MDHKALIASLPPDARRALHETADGPGLARLAAHGGLILGLGALIAAGAPGWPLLMIPQGVLIVFLFTLMHETTHQTPFATGWINEAALRVCGFLLILPPIWFRYFHFAHHRYTNDPARDPELAGGGPQAGRFWLRVSGLPVWRAQIATLLRNAAGRRRDDFLPPARAAEAAWEARAMLAGYALAGAAVWSGAGWLVWCWLAPLLLGQPALRLYLMAEHGRCPAVADMLANSRTTFTNRAVRWLAWNMPYHAEHRAAPNVPFHRLPALHLLARPHLKSTSPGYVAFHRGLARER